MAFAFASVSARSPWIRSRSPGLYEQAHKFLPWGSFVAHMLGAEAVVDYLRDYERKVGLAGAGR